jgi:hypothetical protein
MTYFINRFINISVYVFCSALNRVYSGEHNANNYATVLLLLVAAAEMHLAKMLKVLGYL